MSLVDKLKKYFKREDLYTFELTSTMTPSKLEELEERVKKQANKIYRDLYEKDGLTYMLVNYLEHKIVTGVFFEGDTDLVNRATKWAREVGLVFLLKNIVKDALIHGTGWVEIIPNEDLTDIVGFKVIDPTTIDFIRTSTNKIKLDENGHPEGYVIQVNNTERYWYKDRVIDKGSKDPIITSKKEDLRSRIAYFKLEGYGDSEVGLSFIKPVYRSAIIRCNIADMLGESAFRGGGIVAYFSGRPPQEVIDSLSRDLKNITSRNIFVLSDKFKLDLIPIPDIKERINQIIYLADEQAGAMGIPLDVIMTNVKSYRQDLPSKLMDLEQRIKGYQEYLAFQIENSILKKLKEYWMTNKDLHIMFREYSPTVRLQRTRSLATLSRRGLVKWDPELELHLRKEEGLPSTFVQLQLSEWIEKGRPPEEGKEVDKYDEGE